MAQDNHDSMRDAIRVVSRSIWAVLTAVFLFGGWVASLELRTQHIIRDISEQSVKTAENALRVLELGVWRSTTEADRYSARDHIKYAEHVSAEMSMNATRITRIEDAITAQAKQLDRIERAIDAKHP